jgi:signal peptidase I
VFNPPAGADDGTCGTRPREGSVCPQGTADRSESKFVKRVVAVGGDRVAIRDGRVVLNGQVQDEPYIRADSRCVVLLAAGPLTLREQLRGRGLR